MTPLFTKQTICSLTILLSGFLAAAPIQAQDREPATVAPGSNAISEADIAAGSLKTPSRPAKLGYPKMPLSVRS